VLEAKLTRRKAALGVGGKARVPGKTVELANRCFQMGPNSVQYYYYYYYSSSMPRIITVSDLSCDLTDLVHYLYSFCPGSGARWRKYFEP